MATDLTSRIDALSAEIRQLDLRRSELLQLWAQDACPHEVGDVLTIAPESRNRKQKDMRVTEITFRTWTSLAGEFHYLWVTHGLVLNPDGSVGFREATWDQERHMATRARESA